jgi:hypothetical protein
MQQIPNQEMEAFLAGKPVSADFLNELESRTKNLVSGLEIAICASQQRFAIENWSPDRASEGMADQVFQQPHYQKQASADEMDTPSAGSLPTDQ